MKKIYLLLLLSLSGYTTWAQVPNGDFEKLDSTGKISNWGRIHLLNFWIDSLGNSHSDSIIYDQALYFSTSDAHSGSKALEMRNAQNYTQKSMIFGGADLNGEGSVGYGFPILTPVSLPPTSFNFYYKFLPKGGDSAYATMQLFDSSGNVLGEASVTIGGTISTYTPISVPVIYSQSGVPSFASISFSTAKAGGNVTLGTRFLVDDVSISNLTYIAHPISENNINIYPNPAKDIIYISKNNITVFEQISLYDMTGKRVLESKNSSVLFCESLTKGIYLLMAKSGSENFSRHIEIL